MGEATVASSVYSIDPYAEDASLQPAQTPIWREAMFPLDWFALRASPVYYGCVPVYRWVYGYHGWQQVYAGQRCPSYGYYNQPNYGPHGTFRFNSPGLRLRIGF